MVIFYQGAQNNRFPCKMHEIFEKRQLTVTASAMLVVVCTQAIDLVGNRDMAIFVFSKHGLLSQGIV